MAKINPKWGACHRALLQRHKLTLRGAMIKAGAIVSHATIKDWCDNIQPERESTIKAKVYPYLSVFPRDEAIECLEAADIPVPQEWLTGIDPSVEERIREAVTRVLTDTAPGLSQQEIQHAADAVIETAREMMQEG